MCLISFDQVSGEPAPIVMESDRAKFRTVNVDALPSSTLDGYSPAVNLPIGSTAKQQAHDDHGVLLHYKLKETYQHCQQFDLRRS